MDFDTIPPFTRFADFIRDRVRECDVLIAVIGPRWLQVLHERLDSDLDQMAQISIQAGPGVSIEQAVALGILDPDEFD